ncbi:hypothetical protein WJX81_005065 [Elliptochloris bilobata]|uniref:Hypoxanthine phosphoribosyltransferase n=1 Tax=Elliptochloris bilobata TaxID=381761 RepID=A0AAW1S9F0_9CHLO
MGRQVAADYSGKRPLVVGTLTGAFLFLADLARSLEPVPEGLEVDFVRASSYRGTESSGSVALHLPDSLSVAARHVLLVEDIVDTGRTARRLTAALAGAGAASVRLATLLDKPSRRVVDCTPDYTGFECPDEFVVGYGMDFNGLYRSLPYVGVLRPSVYS